MRALRYDAFGPVDTMARLVEAAQPRPARGQVLVRVHFAAINPLDWKLVEGEFKLFFKSKPPAGIGTDFSGIVEALGSGVSQPAIGTPVVGFINPALRPPGALQQFVAVDARDVLPVGEDEMEAACTLPVAGMAALQICRLAEVKSGHRVLVHGAAGGVGNAAVQVVRALGARPVATCSRQSQPMVATLEPEAIVDYTAQRPASWGGPFNAVLDCACTLGSSEIAVLLSAGGHYVRTLPKFPATVLDETLNRLRPIKQHTLRLAPNANDLRTLLGLLRSGRIKPLISERFAFGNAVAALVRSRSGRAHGKLVVRVE
jgi:NADPH:quinone reductase-like Zn-dependent oxidoreductase